MQFVSWFPNCWIAESISSGCQFVWALQLRTDPILELPTTATTSGGFNLGYSPWLQPRCGYNPGSNSRLIKKRLSYKYLYILLTDQNKQHPVITICVSTGHTYAFIDFCPLADPGTSPIRVVSKIHATLKSLCIRGSDIVFWWTPKASGEVLWQALRGQHIFEKHTRNDNLTVP